MITSALEKRNYPLIGRILYRVHPEIASQIERMVVPGEQTDLQRIFFFYSRFTNINLPGYNDVNKRRLFTAVIMFLYYPQSLKNGLVNVKKGFVKNIAACFDSKQESITRNIREVIIMYRAYEDFAEKVNEILEEFKKETDAANS